MLRCFVLGYIRFGWIRWIWVRFSKFYSRVVLAREGHPSLVNPPLLTEAWVALVRRCRCLAGQAGDTAGKIHGECTWQSPKSLPSLPSASAGKRQWGPPWSKSCHDTKLPVRG